MAPPSDSLAARLRLVAAITDLNSRHLLATGRRGGEEIELARAMQQSTPGDASGVEDPTVAALRNRLAATEAELNAMEEERIELTNALSRL
jgi:hypothetical protein